MRNKNWNSIMLRALAGELKKGEREAWQKALQEDANLREEWEVLQATQDLLEQQDFRVQPFLAGRVMQQIEAEEAVLPVRGLNRAFRALVLPVLAALVGLAVFTYVQEDQLNLEVISGTAELQIEQAVASDWTSF